MEENQAQSVPAVQQQQVSFPQPKELGKGNSNKNIIVALVGVVLIVLVGGWLILRSSSGGSSTASPTPVGGLSSFPTPDIVTPTPTPSPSPSPIAKEKVKIEVLNGTGIPGEATFLQKELSKLGFENIEIGNADTQDQKETTVTFSRELDLATADEITQKLEEIYEKVRTRRSSVSGGFDVSIKTGPRKKSSPTPTPTAKATPTAKTTPSPTPQQLEE